MLRFCGWFNSLNVSFNPCFRGTCSWWSVCPRYIHPSFWFQSLFSWNLLLMTALSNASSSSTPFQSLFSWNLLLMSILPGLWEAPPSVSILVFVELALDAVGSTAQRRSAVGFNPCFRGTCSWCLTGYSTGACVLLFQSLFSWNLLLMIGIGLPSSYPLSVSILVFVELALDEQQIIGGFLNEKFQSLFSWNLLLMTGELDRIQEGV